MVRLAMNGTKPIHLMKEIPQGVISAIRNRTKEKKWSSMVEKVKQRMTDTTVLKGNDKKTPVPTIVAFASTLLVNPKAIAAFSTSTTFELHDSIIIDNGANQHIYNDISHMYDIEDISPNNIFTGGQTEGSTLNIQKQGSMRVNIKAAGGGWVVFGTKKQILLIPSFLKSCSALLVE